MGGVWGLLSSSASSASSLCPAAGRPGSGRGPAQSLTASSVLRTASFPPRGPRRTPEVPPRCPRGGPPREGRALSGRHTRTTCHTTRITRHASPPPLPLGALPVPLARGRASGGALRRSPGHRLAGWPLAGRGPPPPARPKRKPAFLAAAVPCSPCSLQPLFLAAAVSYSRVTPVASHTGRDEQRLLLGGGFPRPASGSVPARNFQDLRLRISGRDSESQAEIDEKGPGAQAPLAHRGAQTRAAGRCHPRPSWTRRPGPGGPAEGRSSTAAAAAHCGRAARRSRGPQ